MKTCRTCRQQKTLDEFGANKRQPDGRQPYCKECSRQKDKKHYAESPERKEKIKEVNERRRREAIAYICDYLKDHPCVDCGENNPVLLEFDHRGDKKGCVSAMLLKSRDLLLAEMEKCDVRCVRCHRLKTAKEFGYYKAILASFV